jgi:SAGA-associated factor 73
LIDEEATTINVSSKKESKKQANGIIKLKKPPPKHSKPGNWKDGSVIDSMLAHVVKV